MKRNISNKILLLALLTLSACSAKKKLIATQKPDTIRVKADTAKMVGTNAKTPETAHLTAQQLGSIQATQLSFTTFSAKAKAKMNIDGNNNDVTLNIRIKRGQEIWVSVTALLGLEGARALITPDSIKIINRLDATYTKKPFSYINQYAGNQVNFQALENLIVGNTWPGLVSDSSAVQPNENGLVLSGALQDILYKLFISNNMRLAKTSMSSRGIVARDLDVEYNGTMQVADRTLPAQININATSIKSKINIALTYTKADFNTNLEFPFQVPSRYSVVN
ncbi:hypothetical protein BEL04_18525 [Mucilaginibacter sp. PPCGB 2223]|uniref:DUF4292 domain-containing protein n=1 Tax=Mucilaginibacter sp. PPCGB 2223 TaxID=1886027 RepID=UPI0008267DA2|nr:DUF4292 domain-containing protein [Mucilaginibacter sp. PPCGB 2223]OCX50734.1 hypothetical protein BEL04_18525 [Mucilaginibacter sp. PPCGB 2223]